MELLTLLIHRPIDSSPFIQAIQPIIEFTDHQVILLTRITDRFHSPTHRFTSSLDLYELEGKAGI